MHPVQYVLYSTSVGALMLVLGFSPVALAVLAPISLVHASLVHANLDWDSARSAMCWPAPCSTAGTTSKIRTAHDKNFAPTFPILDVIFGTFYMPEGVRPQGFGAEDAPSEGYLAQLVYPFKVLAARRSAQGAASQPGG